eukprot:tig00021612_g22867.t1
MNNAFVSPVPIAAISGAPGTLPAAAHLCAFAARPSAVASVRPAARLRRNFGSRLNLRAARLFRCQATPQALPIVSQRENPAPGSRERPEDDEEKQKTSTREPVEEPRTFAEQDVLDAWSDFDQEEPAEERTSDTQGGREEEYERGDLDFMSFAPLFLFSDLAASLRIDVPMPQRLLDFFRVRPTPRHSFRCDLISQALTLFDPVPSTSLIAYAWLGSMLGVGAIQLREKQRAARAPGHNARAMAASVSRRVKNAYESAQTALALVLSGLVVWGSVFHEVPKALEQVPGGELVNAGSPVTGAAFLAALIAGSLFVQMQMARPRAPPARPAALTPRAQLSPLLSYEEREIESGRKQKLGEAPRPRLWGVDASLMYTALELAKLGSLVGIIYILSQAGGPLPSLPNTLGLL